VATAIDGLPVRHHAYSYDGLNRLTSDIRGNHTSQSWTYDEADNLTSVADTGTGSTSTLTYGGNASNTYQLQSLVPSLGGTTSTFGYDQFDRLTSYAKGSTSANYAYNGDGLPLEQITGNGTVSYYVHDQLGSTRELVASGGQIVTFYGYDAYGTLLTSGIYPGYDTPFRYAGQDTDHKRGLQYL
jgi:YD repeat-containing protein